MLMLMRMHHGCPACGGSNVRDRRSGYNVGMTAPEREKVHGPTNDGEKLCHIVPEDDPDTALCGKDVTGWPWNPPWPFCVVCLDLAGYEVS
jgi:endogenous inhibitor of DNA gyrase (YacG/DUF329 family)